MSLFIDESGVLAGTGLGAAGDCPSLSYLCGITFDTTGCSGLAVACPNAYDDFLACGRCGPGSGEDDDPTGGTPPPPTTTPPVNQAGLDVGALVQPLLIGGLLLGGLLVVKKTMDERKEAEG